MKKLIVAAVAAASLTGGAMAFAALAPIGIASAQDSGQQLTAPDSTTNTAPKTAPERRGVRARIKQRVTARRGEIAEYLGLTPEALGQELRSGKSLAEIAGPKTQGLVELLTAKADARIDAALAAGRIDESRAAALEAKVGPAIERLINAKRR
jgi:hypothetical protein